MKQYFILVIYSAGDFWVIDLLSKGNFVIESGCQQSSTDHLKRPVHVWVDEMLPHLLKDSMHMHMLYYYKHVMAFKYIIHFN